MQVRSVHFLCPKSFPVFIIPENYVFCKFTSKKDVFRELKQDFVDAEFNEADEDISVEEVDVF